jgi:hypothetical protein
LTDLNAEQKKILEMLSDFDDICCANKIRYFLADETLLYGVCEGAIQERPAYGSVVMTAANCRKFIKAFGGSGSSDRKLEYWGNSETYPDFSVRYIDEMSLSIDVFDHASYHSHGMYVEISILRGDYPKDKEAEKMAELEKDPGAVRFGRQKQLSRLFDYICDNCSKAHSTGRGLTGTYTLAFGQGKPKTVSAGYFSGDGSCRIYGREFPVPAHPEYFLKKMMPGRLAFDGKSCKIVGSNAERDHFIVDGEIPYEEYLREIAGDSARMEALGEIKKKLDSVREARKPYAKKASRDWNAVTRADLRFKLWEVFKPEKDKIIAMHEAGDYEGLMAAFEPYTRAMAEYEKKKLVFSFDNDLLEIYYDLLAYQGNFEEIDRMITYMPKSHLEPVDPERQV